MLEVQLVVNSNNKKFENGWKMYFKCYIKSINENIYMIMFENFEHMKLDVEKIHSMNIEPERTVCKAIKKEKSQNWTCFYFASVLFFFFTDKYSS